MTISKTRGFLAGLAGGVVAVAVLFAYRFATNMPTLQEALAERMIRLLPYQVFALILAKLQHAAKPLGFAMAIVSMLIGFGVLLATYNLHWLASLATRVLRAAGLGRLTDDELVAVAVSPLGAVGGVVFSYGAGRCTQDATDGTPLLFTMNSM